MSAAITVLLFHVQLSCPTCGRACGDDEVSECIRCGQRHCQYDSWECQCDRDAAEIVQRAEMFNFEQTEE